MSDRNTNTDNVENEYVLFRLGEVRCGIAINHVREINRNSELTKVHTAPSFVRGVINLRGQIVTVVDLSYKLAIKADQNQVGTKNLIVESENELIGFLVDEVDDIVRVDPKDIHPPPSQIDGPFAQFLTEVLETQNGLVRILDVDQLTQK